MNLADDEYILGISGSTDSVYDYFREVCGNLRHMIKQHQFQFDKNSMFDE